MSDQTQKHKNNSYAAFFIMALLLFAGAAIKNFLSDGLKMPWSVLVFIGAVAAVFYFMRDLLTDDKSALWKIVDTLVFLLILACIADLVFAFPFMDNLRKIWQSPVLVVVVAIVFVLFNKLRNPQVPAAEGENTGYSGDEEE